MLSCAQLDAFWSWAFSLALAGRLAGASWAILGRRCPFGSRCSSCLATNLTQGRPSWVLKRFVQISMLVDAWSRPRWAWCIGFVPGAGFAFLSLCGRVWHLINLRWLHLLVLVMTSSTCLVLAAIFVVRQEKVVVFRSLVVALLVGELLSQSSYFASEVQEALLRMVPSCRRVCTSSWAFSDSFPLRMHGSVCFQVAAVLIEHDIVLVVLVLGRAALLVVNGGGCHQLLVDIA